MFQRFIAPRNFFSMGLFSADRQKVYCTNCGEMMRIDAGTVDFYSSGSGARARTSRELMHCKECNREMPFTNSPMRATHEKEDFSKGKNKPKKRGLF